MPRRSPSTCLPPRSCARVPSSARAGSMGSRPSEDWRGGAERARFKFGWIMATRGPGRNQVRCLTMRVFSTITCRSRSLFPRVGTGHLFIGRRKGYSGLARYVGPFRPCASPIYQGCHSFCGTSSGNDRRLLDKPPSRGEARWIIRSVPFWLYGRHSRGQ